MFEKMFKKPVGRPSDESASDLFAISTIILFVVREKNWLIVFIRFDRNIVFT